MLKFLKYSMLFFLLVTISCVTVKPWEKEKLADPIMEPQSQFAKQKLDDKFFTSREGSMGGSGGIGGGCGCAK
ncbi:MAG: DUF4266 domain-containing protein [Calditrichaeota bacterium]|nr:MAG: DUF4266 domain-containing protein [Calditrichota bacterium]MBL1205769.1 DUF4266 domain-containing protein [Calditrichota bacterium]NOG45597.1 DUF4266 domain-containing protein [Calditrichota bacterium]